WVTLFAILAGGADAMEREFGSAGGQRGIRTLDRLAPIHAFQACAFNHSATCPERRVMAGAAIGRKARNSRRADSVLNCAHRPPPTPTRLVRGVFEVRQPPTFSAKSKRGFYGPIHNYAQRRPNP